MRLIERDNKTQPLQAVGALLLISAAGRVQDQKLVAHRTMILHALKGLRYGTMPMDMEKRKIVALLPECSAERFALWLGLHPEVDHRCGLCAAAGRRAVTSAVQIADRYHLMSNLSEAMEREVQRMQIEAWQQVAPMPAPVSEEHKSLTLLAAGRQRCRQVRYQLHQTVLAIQKEPL